VSFGRTTFVVTDNVSDANLDFIEQKYSNKNEWFFKIIKLLDK